MKKNIKFDGKKSLSVNMNAAMDIKDADEAKQFLDDYVEFLREKNSWTIETCFNVANGDLFFEEELAKKNLGYWAGYHSVKTRERVERLFDCEHPIFGRYAEMGSPTNKEALECGRTGKTLKEIRAEKK